MKKFLCLLMLCAFYTDTHAQDKLGVGLRVGDPTGVTLKKYSGDKAFEFVIGRPYYLSGYNHDYFYNHDNRFKGKGYTFERWRAAMSIQFHYLIHKDFPQLKGLKWYYGFGAQFRLKSFFQRSVVNGIVVESRASDYDFGPDGVIGLEYTFEELPISIFLDATLFVEIINTPYPYGQAGFGGRYNF